MKKVWAPLAIVILGLLVYSDTFFNSFHFDDIPEIVDNVALRDIHHVGLIWGAYPARFIPYFSFALNYHWGALHVAGYHVLSLAFHLGAAFLVFVLVRLTLNLPSMMQEPLSQYANQVAFFSGLIFLVHPLQTQAVNYIYQRSVLLAAFFYLGALVFYIKARTTANRSVIYYLLALCFGFMSLISKESTVTLPLMVLLYEFYFLRQGKTINWPVALPFFVLLLLLPWAWNHPLNVTVIKGIMSDNNIDGRVYALTQLKVVTTYIRLLFLPIHQSVDYYFPLVHSFWEPSVILSAAFELALVVLAVIIYHRSKLISFSILWFFITLLPESSFWPNHDVIFEHRLYLPMLGFAVLLPSVIYGCWGNKFGNLSMRILVFIVLVLSVLCYQRNQVWLNEITLWNDAIAKSPHNSRAYLNRGAAYQKAGDLDHAMQDYNMVIGLGPITAPTLSNRGSIFEQKGDFTHALANYELALKIDPHFYGTYINRALLYKEEGQYDLALNDIDVAIKAIPSDMGLVSIRSAILELKSDPRLSLSRLP